MAALAVLKRPDVFKAAVAGAPVIDWRDYDTYYTERYLGLPGAPGEAYEKSSLLRYARDSWSGRCCWSTAPPTTTCTSCTRSSSPTRCSAPASAHELLPLSGLHAHGAGPAGAASASASGPSEFFQHGARGRRAPLTAKGPGPPGAGPWAVRERRVTSRYSRLDVLRLQTLGAAGHLELHLLALGEGAEPVAWMAVWWQNTSSPPPSWVMKPKPFASLNHFTVPVAMRLASLARSRQEAPRGLLSLGRRTAENSAQGQTGSQARTTSGPPSAS